MDPAIAIAAQTERRRQQNRLAAAASRVKRQQYINELEQRIQQLTDTNQQLTTQLQLARQSNDDSGTAAATPSQVALATAIPLPQPQPTPPTSSHAAAARPMSTDTSLHVSIVPLSACPQHVDATAALLYAEWAALFVHDNIHSVQQLADKLRTRNPPPPPTTAPTPDNHHSLLPLPVTLVALAHNNTELIGTATLDTSDLPPTHPYYPVTPWLSSVLVSERWRGRGVAGRLVRGVEAEARRRGLGWLWLWTVKPTSVSMYAHLGWRPVERLWLAEATKHITIMRNDLIDRSQPQHTISSTPATLASLPLPTQVQCQSQPVCQSLVDMGAVYERLECMVESLAGYEDISLFTRVAAQFARERLSVLEKGEHDTSDGQTEQ